MALSSVLLALAGHVLGGGSAHPTLPLLVVGAPLAGAFVVWADRRRGTRELAGAALGSQLAYHAVFVVCDDVGALARSSTGGVQLVLGHGLAALGMAWVLSRGEAALSNLYRVLQRVGISRLHALAFDVRPQWKSVVTVLPAGCGSGLLLASACVRRGPPGPSAV
jgi:hypothetical protein